MQQDINSMKIEGGTYQVSTRYWRYPTWRNGEPISVLFTAEEDEVPEIGDFITNGKLVKRVGYQIVDDKSMWLPPPDNEWGRGTP